MSEYSRVERLVLHLESNVSARIDEWWADEVGYEEHEPQTSGESAIDLGCLTDDDRRDFWRYFTDVREHDGALWVRRDNCTLTKSL